jgi:hypothetical protein
MPPSQSLSNPYALNSVRTFKNYGFYIEGATAVDPIFSKGWMTVTPNVLVKGNTCYIDYSHVYDTSNRVYLKRTFGSFTGGSGKTFYFSPTEYVDEETNSRYTVGGTCNFSQSLNDTRIIIATIGSGFTSNSNYNYYKKENFTSNPQYTFTDTGSTGYYYLINSLPELSPTGFINSGALGTAFGGAEEYIEITGGTAQNYGRIPIYGASVLKDGQEIMYFTSGGTAQDLTTAATTINLYLRGDPTWAQNNNSQSSLGIILVKDLNGNIAECYENQNTNQSIYRSKAFSSSYTGSFILCKNCPDVIYGENLSLPTGLILDSFLNVLFLYITTTTVGSTTYYSLNTQSIPSRPNPSVATINPNTSILSLTNFQYLASGSNLKIDLSHPSLLGFEFDAFSDPERTIKANEIVNVFGPLGYNTSYAYAYIATSSIRTLYCTLYGPQTINFTVTFS